MILHKFIDINYRLILAIYDNCLFLPINIIRLKLNWGWESVLVIGDWGWGLGSELDIGIED